MLIHCYAPTHHHTTIKLSTELLPAGGPSMERCSHCSSTFILLLFSFNRMQKNYRAIHNLTNICRKAREWWMIGFAEYEKQSISTWQLSAVSAFDLPDFRHSRPDGCWNPQSLLLSASTHTWLFQFIILAGNSHSWSGLFLSDLKGSCTSLPARMICRPMGKAQHEPHMFRV